MSGSSGRLVNLLSTQFKSVNVLGNSGRDTKLLKLIFNLSNVGGNIGSDDIFIFLQSSDFNVSGSSFNKWILFKVIVKWFGDFIL